MECTSCFTWAMRAQTRLQYSCIGNWKTYARTWISMSYFGLSLQISVQMFTYYVLSKLYLYARYKLHCSKYTGIPS